VSFVTRIVKIEDSEIKAIEVLSLTSESTLLYTSLNYMKLLKNFLQCEILIIQAIENERIIAYLPLAFKNSITGTVCNSLPFYGSNGGIIISPSSENKEEILSALNVEYQKLVAEKNCISSTIISNPLDGEMNQWLNDNLAYDFVDERIGQVTFFPELKENLEVDLLNSFENPRPRNIRKALKEGVRIHSSNSNESMDFLYKVHYDNIMAIGGIPKEKRFFDLIPSFFSDNEYKIYISEYNGERIGALLLFYYNRTVEYFTPAVVEKYRNLQPTALIIYEAMIEAIKGGYRNWNWGGTWLTQGGVYDFKKKWGTTDNRYFYYTKIYKPEVLNATQDFLLKEYPYFFVVPFSALKKEIKND